MIKINDTLALDFFSASPNFDESQNYPVWHFIKMRKMRYEKSMIPDDVFFDRNWAGACGGRWVGPRLLMG